MARTLDDDGHEVGVLARRRLLERPEPLLDESRVVLVYALIGALFLSALAFRFTALGQAEDFLQPGTLRPSLTNLPTIREDTSGPRKGK